MPPSTETLSDVAAELKAHLGDMALEITENHGQLIARVPADKRPEALAVTKALGFTYYSFGGGVDRPEQDIFEMMDHVESMDSHVQITVKCDVPRSNPRMPTATRVYGGADWAERETWEMFGIVFVGHPRLRRLLLADWHEGFPMRKDSLLRPRIEKPWPGDFFSG